MINNKLKGSIIILILLLFLFSVSTVASADNQTGSDINILTLSQGGITIKYPSNWGVSHATSNYSIMSIAKLDGIDDFGIGQVNVNIEKKPVEGDFATFVNDSYKSMEKDTHYQLVSSGTVAIDGKEAYEYIYTSTNQLGVQKEHKAIWFEKGGQAYVIMYSAPLNQFEDNLRVFDFILSEIQIT